MEQLYPSQSQPVCKAALCVARDRGKVQSRRKYVFTDQVDRLIREIYLNHRDAKTRPGIRLLAKKVGMPHWALKKRARELGLARTKELPWTERELEILARYAWMSDERIRLKLKAAGYSRTVTGIHLKLKRMRFKHDRELLLRLQSYASAGDRPSRRDALDQERPFGGQIPRHSTRPTAERRQLPDPREGCPPLYPRTPNRYRSAQSGSTLVPRSDHQRIGARRLRSLVRKLLDREGESV